MKASSELKVLKQISAILDDTSSQLRKVRLFIWGSRILGWVLIFGAVFLVKQSVISTVTAILVTAFGGVGIGLAIYGSMALVQWPALKDHVNEESLNARIRELET